MVSGRCFFCDRFAVLGSRKAFFKAQLGCRVAGGGCLAKKRGPFL